MEISIYVSCQGSALMCGCMLHTLWQEEESGSSRQAAGLCEMGWCPELQWNPHTSDSSAHSTHLALHAERAHYFRSCTYWTKFRSLKVSQGGRILECSSEWLGSHLWTAPPASANPQAISDPAGPLIVLFHSSISGPRHGGDPGTISQGDAPLLLGGSSSCSVFGRGGRNGCRWSEYCPTDTLSSNGAAQGPVLVLMQTVRGFLGPVELSAALTFSDLSEAGQKASKDRICEHMASLVCGLWGSLILLVSAYAGAPVSPWDMPSATKAIWGKVLAVRELQPPFTGIQITTCNAASWLHCYSGVCIYRTRFDITKISSQVRARLWAP